MTLDTFGMSSGSGYLMGKSQVFFMSSAYLKGKDFGSVLQTQRLNEILIKALDLPNCQ